jgi:hypothetical protein
MSYDEAIRSLQDTAVVMAEIQRRQSDVRKPKPDWSRAVSNSSSRLKRTSPMWLSGWSRLPTNWLRFGIECSLTLVGLVFL